MFSKFPFYTSLFTSLVLTSGLALAQDGLPIQAQNAMPSVNLMTTSARQGLLLPNEQTAESLLEARSGENITPFGANLFAGGYETERVDGISENYLIAPGDKLNIWIWGAINHAEVVTVDNQGNIFIPNIGPVQVGNTYAGDVNEFVASKIQRIYKKNVQVYVNLLSATPVSIYISGAVVRPGQYAGMASDSILYFLKRAGGIDNRRGSYRKVKLKRGDDILHSYDLYDFIRKGKLKDIHLKDGDVLLVDHQLPSVSVTGKVKYPFKFELKRKTTTGGDLISLAKPYVNASHVGIAGDRKDGPFSVYLNMAEFKNFKLKDGDNITFNDDVRAQVQDIQVTGSHLGPSFYTVDKPTRLHDFLAHVEIDPRVADYKSIYILRESVAQQQKEALDKSLQRLERATLTAPASSDGEAVIRAKEAELVARFVEKARLIEPKGKVIVSDMNNIANVLLEQNDIIVIPEKTDLVLVTGEVLMPQALVFTPGSTVEDYLKWSGGFTLRADESNIAVLHANGLLEIDSDTPLVAGDQILVLPKVDSKNMQLVKDVTQILYQIAIAANVVTRLND